MEQGWLTPRHVSWTAGPGVVLLTMELVGVAVGRPQDQLVNWHAGVPRW